MCGRVFGRLLRQRVCAAVVAELQWRRVAVQQNVCAQWLLQFGWCEGVTAAVRMSGSAMWLAE